MKVCFLVRAMPCHQHGGLEYHTLTLAKQLANNGITPVILTTQHENGYPCSMDYQDLEVIHLPDTKPAQYSFSFFKNASKLIKNDKKIDIVHSEGFAGLGYAWTKNNPLVTTIHGTLTSETSLEYEETLSSLWKNRKRIIIYPFYQHLLNKSDKILVDSAYSKDLVVKNIPDFPRKIAIIPLGVNEDFFRPYPKSDSRKDFNLPDNFTILALGRITETKGFQVLIEAMTHLMDIPISLVIAGDGPYQKQLEDLALSRQMKNISFIRNIPEEKKPLLYSSADVFIFPDLTSPAFGLVTIEAMSCEVPVIATNSGALPEILSPDTGFLFPRGDSKQLAQLIRFLYEETNIRRQIGKNARMRVLSLYTAERMANDYKNIYATKGASS